jgi:hypothetical protein
MEILRTAVLAAACVGLMHGGVRADDPEASRRDPGLCVLAGVLVLDAGLTIYDLATLGEDKPAIYGFGETVVTVPQVLAFGGIAVLLDREEHGWIAKAAMLWTAALATHGIYTLAQDDEPEPMAGRTVMLSFGSRF